MRGKSKKKSDEKDTSAVSAMEIDDSYSGDWSQESPGDAGDTDAVSSDSIGELLGEGAVFEGRGSADSSSATSDPSLTLKSSPLIRLWVSRLAQQHTQTSGVHSPPVRLEALYQIADYSAKPKPPSATTTKEGTAVRNQCWCVFLKFSTVVRPGIVAKLRHECSLYESNAVCPNNH